MEIAAAPATVEVALCVDVVVATVAAVVLLTVANAVKLAVLVLGVRVKVEVVLGAAVLVAVVPALNENAQLVCMCTWSVRGGDSYEPRYNCSDTARDCCCLRLCD